MSIFKNSKFSKATAFVASAGSLMPLLTKECSNSKVFAEGKAQKIFEFFKNILSQLLSRFLNEENVKKAMDFLGLLAKEQDEKEEKDGGKEGEKDEEDRKEKEEGKEDENEEESKKEKNDKVDKEGKGENDQNYAPVPVPVKKEENIEFKEDFDLGTIKKINEICNSLAEVDSTFFDNFDAEKFKLKPNCSRYGFEDICHVVGNFDRLNSDSCSFETDNQGNLAIRSKWRCSEGETVEENFHFKVNENGMILVNLHGKVVPFRLVGKENRNFCRNEFTAHIAKGLEACLAYSYIDVDEILRSCLLRSNWETIGVRDNILKLKNIFERKDNNKVFLNKINDAIDIWNLLTPIVSELENQFHNNISGHEGKDYKAHNAFLRKQKVIYVRNFLTELFKIIEDKKVKLSVRRILRGAIDRLYLISQKASKTSPDDNFLDVVSSSFNFS